jgi:hypothetical protein
VTMPAHPALRNLRRRVAHGLALLAGWGLFFWSWHLVTAGRPEFGELSVLIAGAALVVPVLTLSWIVHNVGIHRRKGPRRAVPSADMKYVADFMQRRVEADWWMLARARCIEITLDDDVKRYRAMALGAAPQQPAPRHALQRACAVTQDPA